MRVLALNFGSTTLKWALFSMPSGINVGGMVDAPSSPLDALRGVRAELERTVPSGLDAIGHRIVHGGAHARPIVLDPGSERDIARLTPLAPQHNAAALDGVRAARELWPGAAHVAVFDTAFHTAMPAHATTYAVPARWRDAGLKRYGFHGLSHEHVGQAVAASLAVPLRDLKLVSCHLGNGASVCAISNGRSVDTSMGLTPLEGLVMGTRCGDLDPGACGFLARNLQLGIDEIEEALHAESGMKALSGVGGDMRRIEAAAAQGHEPAQFALRLYAYRLRKYIGAYAAAMGGCDAVAFTGGVGENSPLVRAQALEGLRFLGLELDEGLNRAEPAGAWEVRPVHAAGSRGKVLVVRTQEQRVIARAVYKAMARDGPAATP